MSDNSLHNILLLAAGIASFWDGFTTVFGTATILDGGVAAGIAGLLFGLLIMSLMLNSKRVIETSTDSFEGMLFRVLWFIAVFYDLYTSWLGNQEFILGQDASGSRIAVLIGLTLLVSGSPVLVSFLWNKKQGATPTAL